jgi:hypothetical protein
MVSSRQNFQEQQLAAPSNGDWGKRSNIKKKSTGTKRQQKKRWLKKH